MKVLLVDDHPLFRKGLFYTLAAIAKENTVIEASSVCQALDVMENHSDIDVILLDVVLANEDGLEQLPFVRQRFPSIPVIIISALEERSRVQSALDNGAQGYISKSASPDVITGAIQLVMSGGTYLPAFIMSAATAAPHREPSGFTHSTLTKRQLAILDKLATGLPNKKIANELGIAEATVRAHVTEVLKSLNASNRTEAVYNARKLGWLEPA